MTHLRCTRHENFLLTVRYEYLIPCFEIADNSFDTRHQAACAAHYKGNGVIIHHDDIPFGVTIQKKETELVRYKDESFRWNFVLDVSNYPTMHDYLVHTVKGGNIVQYHQIILSDHFFGGMVTEL